MNIQYLTDEKGHQTAVVVPIRDWARLTSEVEKFHKKELLFQNIQASFQEIEDSKAGKKQLQPIETLFND